MHLLRLLPFLAALAPAACSVSLADDKPPVLFTQASGPGSFAPKTAVVGVPFPVQVAELALPGGNCGLSLCPPGVEQLTLVSASCEGATCTTRTDGTLQGGPAFLVTPTTAGPTTVHVTVRRPSGATMEDTLPMTFLDTGTIGVRDHAYKMLVGRVAHASLVGTELTWKVTLEGPDGKDCAATTDAFAMHVDGDAFGPTGALESEAGVQHLRAQHAGVSHVRFSVGAATRTVALTAVGPADVTAIELHALTSSPNTPLDSLDVEAEDGVAPDADMAPAVHVSYEDSHWVVLLRMRDGTTAVGGADKFAVAPSAIATLSAPAGSATLALTPHRNGTGTLAATVGTATISLPLTIATK